MTARYLSGAALALCLTGVFYWTTHWPFSMARDSEALLTVSLRIVSEANLHCRKATAEEISKMLPHMRRDEICERARALARMRVTVDGRETLDKSFKPLGLQSDGSIVAMESFPIPMGEHEVTIDLKSSTGGDDWDHRFRQKIAFREGYRSLIEFQKEKGFQVY